MKIAKWVLYAVSWGVIVDLTWDMPLGAYLLIQLAVLGVFVSGAMRND